MKTKTTDAQWSKAKAMAKRLGRGWHPYVSDVSMQPCASNEYVVVSQKSIRKYAAMLCVLPIMERADGGHDISKQIERNGRSPELALAAALKESRRYLAEARDRLRTIERVI